MPTSRRATRAASDRRRRLPPAERRAQLLATALEVFAEQGLGRARHAEIAKRAGVAVSTVFLYFTTRRDLVRTVLDEVDQFFSELSVRVHAQVGKPCREVLREHGAAFLASIDSHPAHVRIWLDWSTSFREETFEGFLDFTERLVGVYADTIRRGQSEGEVPAHLDAEASARLLVGAAQMVAQLKLTHRGDDTWLRSADALVEAALGGTAA